MRQRGLSGSTLKMIAIITMFVDHFAAAVLGRLLMVGGPGALNGTAAGVALSWLSDNAALYEMYIVMRMVIGRIAFPIFCFLLIEGFVHTGNRTQYALRLGVFALISEVPFDLAFSGTLLELGHQNIFFTLFLGLLTIMVYSKIEEQEYWNRWLRTVLQIAVVLIGMEAAQVLHTDYAALGILCVVVLFLFRKSRKQQVLAGCLSFFWWEQAAVLAFVPIYFYNGKRGWNIKYFFYLFYPLHLLLLYLICVGMGIGDISVM